MRKTVLLSVWLILFSAISFSMEHDWPKKNDKHKTKSCEPEDVYLDFSLGYSKIDKQRAFIYGGKIEYQWGHSIDLGVGGIRFVNFSHYDNTLKKHIILKGGGNLILIPNSANHQFASYKTTLIKLMRMISKFYSFQ